MNIPVYRGAWKTIRCKMKNKKPPIGLLPTHLWKNKRMMDISDAIARYVYNYKKIPNEWIVELEELNEGVK